jgi:putative ABC transport system permease protein
LAGGLAAAVVIGAAAGLYPAARAARLSPTDALRTA